MISKWVAPSAALPPDVYVGVELIFRLAVDHTLEVDIDQQVFGFAGREGGLRMDVQITFVADGRRDESAAASRSLSMLWS